MIVIVAALVGMAAGVAAARRQQGNRLDQLQYAAGFAIAFAIGGLFLAVIIDRMM
jgi:hypothetical protein